MIGRMYSAAEYKRVFPGKVPEFHSLTIAGRGEEKSEKRRG
jgi:hypothetical protein